MTRQEFIKMVARNHNTGQWLNGTYDVDGTQVGVKAYGKWLQRLQVPGKPYYSNIERQTVTAFKQDIESGLIWLLG